MLPSGRIENLSAEADDIEERWVAMTTEVVELSILPAEPDWAARTLERARADLASAEENRRRNGCAVLRHLGTRDVIAELVIESVEGSAECRGDAGLGLFAHPDREAVVGAMEAHIATPEGVIDALFLSLLARLASLTEHPIPADGAKLSSDDYAEIRRGIEEKTAAYATRLADAVDKKRDRARASSLTALLETTERLQTVPGLELGGLRSRLAQHFGELTPKNQASLLEHRWHLLRDPSFRPVLLRLYENPPKLPWIGGKDLRDLAIQRLCDLDPTAARDILLAEMRRPLPRLDATVFELFPSAVLPAEVEATVVEHLRQMPSAYKGLTELATIIGRYGSPAVREDIVAIYDSPDFAELRTCWRPPFLAYFLRVALPSGSDRLKAALARPEPGRYSDCVGKRLGEVAAFGFPPALESVAIELLDSGEAKLEISAVEVLGRHGSAAAEAPLWQRLDRWQRKWRSRPDELVYDRATGRYRNEQAVEMERALVAALSKGAGWVADRSAFERLTVSDQTKQEIRRMTRRMGDEPKLTVWNLARSHFAVDQYDARSIAALRTRLALFPEGTVFRLVATGRKVDPAAVEAFLRKLETWLAEQGKGLVHQ